MNEKLRRFSPRRLPIALIRLYQKWSANTPPVCRFSPTCSAYAIEAYQRYGIGIGTGLTLWRLLRCNPLFRGGFDPVPTRIAWPGRKDAAARSDEAAKKTTRKRRFNFRK